MCVYILCLYCSRNGKVVSRRRELILKLTIELLFVKQFVGIVLKMVSSKQIIHV